MTLKSSPNFPIERTYVVKLSRDATADSFSGRIENLVTGQRRDFTTAEQLLAQIASDLVPRPE
jgi:hypothetical protein